MVLKALILLCPFCRLPIAFPQGTSKTNKKQTKNTKKEMNKIPCHGKKSEEYFEDKWMD
jgi:hypothetical protein